MQDVIFIVYSIVIFIYREIFYIIHTPHIHTLCPKKHLHRAVLKLHFPSFYAIICKLKRQPNGVKKCTTRFSSLAWQSVISTPAGVDYRG